MSSVRWCDKHNGPFSENTDGWSTMSGSRKVVSKDGRQEFVSVEMDVCGPCNDGTFQAAQDGPAQIAATVTDDR